MVIKIKQLIRECSTHSNSTNQACIMKRPTSQGIQRFYAPHPPLLESDRLAKCWIDARTLPFLCTNTPPKILLQCHSHLAQQRSTPAPGRSLGPDPCPRGQGRGHHSSNQARCNSKQMHGQLTQSLPFQSSWEPGAPRAGCKESNDILPVYFPALCTSARPSNAEKPGGT